MFSEHKCLGKTEYDFWKVEEGIEVLPMEKVMRPYDKEYMKMAMLKHEETFKQQVIRIVYLLVSFSFSVFIFHNTEKLTLGSVSERRTFLK